MAWNKRKKKSMQTALYGKIKKKGYRDRRWMINWSDHTKCILHFNCNNTIQDKPKALKAPLDEG